MRIEEKEYTKSIDISIWKKGFFLHPEKAQLIMVITVMNISLLNDGYYHAVISATGH